MSFHPYITASMTEAVLLPVLVCGRFVIISVAGHEL